MADDKDAYHDPVFPQRELRTIPWWAMVIFFAIVLAVIFFVISR